MGSKEDCQNDPSDTIVGMEPITIEDDEIIEIEEKTNVHTVTSFDSFNFFPVSPKSINQTGLTQTFIEELILKHIFKAGSLRGMDIATRLCLPSLLIERILRILKRQQLVEIKGSGSSGIGHSHMIYKMTKAGHKYCEYAMERDEYVGPAPVPFHVYQQAVNAQTIRGNVLQKKDIVPYFSDLVITEDIFNAIGPAINSGKAMFLYGPPGNGKTAICQRITNCFGENVFVPYSIIADDFVIKVFDEHVHKKVPFDSGNNYDERWTYCKRPMVMVGGELTLEDLDLSFSSNLRFYQAPFQLKANNGMLLIDDFGRQKVSPKDLLNRWIIPLESSFDILSMHTGKKLQVPFDVFVVFSTNLDPATLVDQAFLRRVPYKLQVKQPSETLYNIIFQAECNTKGVPFEPDMVKYLIEKHYKAKGVSFNACEPRDLLNQIIDLCRYRGIQPCMTKEIIDKVVTNYFVKLTK